MPKRVAAHKFSGLLAACGFEDGHAVPTRKCRAAEEQRAFVIKFAHPD
jgi:hypothetical protein